MLKTINIKSAKLASISTRDIRLFKKIYLLATFVNFLLAASGTRDNCTLATLTTRDICTARDICKTRSFRLSLLLRSRQTATTRSLHYVSSFCAASNP